MESLHHGRFTPVESVPITIEVVLILEVGLCVYLCSYSVSCVKEMSSFHTDVLTHIEKGSTILLRHNNNMHSRTLTSTHGIIYIHTLYTQHTIIGVSAPLSPPPSLYFSQQGHQCVYSQLPLDDAGMQTTSLL